MVAVVVVISLIVVLKVFFRSFFFLSSQFGPFRRRRRCGFDGRALCSDYSVRGGVSGSSGQFGSALQSS